MDDAHPHEPSHEPTRDSLDALADLFLTGAGPGAVSGSASASASRAAVVDQLDAPAPIRLPPKRATPRPAPAPIATPAVGATADAATPATPPLRLRRDEPDEPVSDVPPPDDAGDLSPFSTSDTAAVVSEAEPMAAADSPASDSTDSDSAPVTEPLAAVCVEAVFLGNLPGFGGPWLTQYAQLVANEHGPVAVLHVEEGYLDVELVEPAGSAALASYGTRARVSDHQRPDLLQLLDRLFRDPVSPVQTVLVHLQADPIDEVARRAASFDTWTLLAGADEGAVNAGQHLLRQLVEACHRSSDAEGDGDGNGSQRRIGVMVMGSDEAPSREAMGKLGEAATAFLPAPLEMVGFQKQMSPVNLRQLGRFVDQGGLWSRLLDLFEQVRPAADAWDAEPEPQPAPTPKPATLPPAPRRAAKPQQPPIAERTPPPTFEPMTPASAAPAAPAASAARSPRRSVPPIEPPVRTPRPDRSRPRREPEPVRSSPSSTHARHEPSAAPTPPPSHRPAAAATPSPTATRHDDEPDLASFLIGPQRPLAGSVLLDARCPDHPQSQIVLDQDGRLHVLRRHVEQRDGALPGLRSALIDLIEVRHWLEQHLGLIALTQRQCRFQPEARPVLHLFTDRADLATGLVARLNEQLKLHLLQEIHLNGHSAWYSTPLN